MNKHFYLELYDLKTTIDFVNEFQNILFNSIKENFQIIIIDLPLSCNTNSKIANYNLTFRTVNFDNSSNFEIYELISDYDALIRYFYYKYNPNEKQILFFKYNEINRDSKLVENTVETLIYNFEFKTKAENRNKVFLKEIGQKFLKIIENTVNKISFVDNNFSSKINFYEFKKIKTKLISYSHKKAFYDFIKIKKSCGIIFDKKNFFKIHKNKSIFGYDSDNTLTIYWWNEYMHEVLEIITITIRPDFNIINEVSKDNIDSKIFDNNELYEIIQLDKIAISYSVKLYFDNLMTILLKKKSTKELPSKINDFEKK